jgi:glycerol-3-phosphate dehydrogenase
MFDVIILGGGVIGAHVARNLSRYDLKIGVLERATDVCEFTSKANSGIVHSGIDAVPGSLKAKYNLRGNAMMASTCEQLDVPFRRNGSMILCFGPEEEAGLQELYDQGITNGVEGLRILSGDEARALEPNLTNQVHKAILAPTGGIVDPFKLTLMAAEVAAKNGVRFFFRTEVQRIVKQEDHFLLETRGGTFQTKTVVNAAGVYADVFHNQVSNTPLSITPRKGEYCLFDKEVGDLVDHTLFQLPTAFGKGVVVTPTVEGNLLVGPTAYDIENKEDTSTTVEGLKYVVEKARKSVKQVPMHAVITAFAGLRATEKHKDFVLGEVPDAPGFIDAAGIESPGLTAAPAIGEDLAKWVAAKLNAQVKKTFAWTNRAIPDFEKAPIDQKAKWIDADKDYGQIVCRCELVTLAQIKEAIHRPLGATTIDGVKRRTRAGSGRCQGGFCSPRILEILAKELHKDPREIAKFGEQSTYLVGLDKELLG